MDEYEVSLADYIMVLWRRKWVVIVTFLLAVGAAYFLSAQQPDEYRVETSLLILPPLAADITDQVPGTVYSPETYKRFALARDLLQVAIERTYPEGTPLTPSRLEERMSVEIDATAARDFPGRFPLYLRVSFSGEDRASLPRLADAWAEAFIDKNAELFVSRIAQSFDYISESFSEVERDLRERQDALRQLREVSQPEVLRAELEALEEVYAGYVRDLAFKERELVQEEAQLALLEGYLEDPVSYALAQGELSGAYSAHARDLTLKEQQLSLAQGKLIVLETALQEEPEYYALTRCVSPEALWQFLGASSEPADPDRVEAFLGLTMDEQVLNTGYVELRAQVLATQAEVDTLGTEVAQLAQSSQALWRLLNDGAVGSDEDVGLDVTVVREVLARTEFDLRGEIAASETRVGELASDLALLERQVEETKGRIESRRSLLVASETETEQLSQEINVLERSYERMADKLQDARIARAETAEPIRVVEAALPGTVRTISPGRTMNLAVAGVLGLFMGVLLAFVVHAVRERQLEQAAVSAAGDTGGGHQERPGVAPPSEDEARRPPE